MGVQPMMRRALLHGERSRVSRPAQDSRMGQMTPGRIAQGWRHVKRRTIKAPADCSPMSRKVASKSVLSICRHKENFRRSFIGSTYHDAVALAVRGGQARPTGITLFVERWRRSGAVRVREVGVRFGSERGERGGWGVFVKEGAQRGGGLVKRRSVAGVVVDDFVTGGIAGIGGGGIGIGGSDRSLGFAAEIEVFEE
nr:hypothetical protein CFP56_69682 [Quercus suber]